MASDSETGQLGHDRRTTYEKWTAEEGLPVIQGFYVADLKKLELSPWKRRGGLGAYINLEGAGGTNDAYVAEILPGSSLKPEKYMFEELIYVLSGRGATTIWNEGGKKQTFEWQAGSLFSPPLNVWRQHFNGQGDQPARFLAVTTAPMVMDLYHSLEFVFNNPFVFRERYAGEDDYFSGNGKTFVGPVAKNIWQSNFIPDVAAFRLTEWKERGAGGANVMFELADNSLAAHVSEFPVGTYKKAHRHGPGAHVVILGGEGYSLLWEGEQPKTRVDWHAGSMFVPPDMWFHQHFNVGAAPARYLALRWGSQKFRMGGVFKRASAPETAISTRIGGNQIEYEDEDPEVRRIFEHELAARNVDSRMAQFFKQN